MDAQIILVLKLSGKSGSRSPGILPRAGSEAVLQRNKLVQSTLLRWNLAHMVNVTSDRNPWTVCFCLI